ncbi:MAG: 4-hydroxythreonine-4-phosphate dehydrogenase [Betaproteobacteria bacterium]|nr:4-hydroxythreonine-4-phosphate dehydrogenase [Betaproteobacteria bacterium]
MSQPAQQHRPLIGLMLGDVTGIGPEVSARVLADPTLHEQARMVVVGDARVLELGMRDAGCRLPVQQVAGVSEVDWASGTIPLIDLADTNPADFQRGLASPEAGRLCGEALKRMTDMALASEIEAVCFAPLNKGAMNRGGWKYHDEHAMFADWNHHQGYYGEVNLINLFCTFRVTSHVSLREAVDLVIPERIEGAIRLAYTVLTGMGMAQPRIGVAALNPHGGEGGLFGREEIEIIGPTLEDLRAKGLETMGPFPSDTVFLKAKAGVFDAVVIMYHDQGQIATKLLGFSEGVTLTGGLKTLYTTPAHGTAYDIVGQGKAHPGAMRRALAVAIQLARARH